MKKILVVGGAGYIGSHMTKALALADYYPITLDDLSTGSGQAVRYGGLVLDSMGNRNLLETLFRSHEIAAVMHFASFSQVGESVANPAAYYTNNVAQTLTLLDAMVANGIKRFIFSSTAAVYGQPVTPLIDESHPKQAINPYGRSKWMVEQILNDYEKAYGLNAITLRYFNAAGADPAGELGENHDPETHLIPLVLQAGLGQRGPITLFGNDYDTPDGTCVRDYIHVQDLCGAHLLALEKLLDGGKSDCYNLGNGNGFSVLEVIRACERVLGRPVPTLMGDRRQGDPAILVADATKAERQLGWRQQWSDLEQIIAHAAAWEHLKASVQSPAQAIAIE